MTSARSIDFPPILCQNFQQLADFQLHSPRWVTPPAGGLAVQAAPNVSQKCSHGTLALPDGQPGSYYRGPRSEPPGCRDGAKALTRSWKNGLLIAIIHTTPKFTLTKFSKKEQPQPRDGPERHFPLAFANPTIVFFDSSPPFLHSAKRVMANWLRIGSELEQLEVLIPLIAPSENNGLLGHARLCQ